MDLFFKIGDTPREQSNQDVNAPEFILDEIRITPLGVVVKWCKYENQKTNWQFKSSIMFFSELGQHETRSEFVFNALYPFIEEYNKFHKIE